VIADAVQEVAAWTTLSEPTSAEMFSTRIGVTPERRSPLDVSVTSRNLEAWNIFSRRWEDEPPIAEALAFLAKSL